MAKLSDKNFGNAFCRELLFTWISQDSRCLVPFGQRNRTLRERARGFGNVNFGRQANVVELERLCCASSIKGKGLCDDEMPYPVSTQSCSLGDDLLA